MVRHLGEPFFTPPDWLFAPVWTLLYVLIGVAAGRVGYYGHQHRNGRTAHYLFGFQLLFNGLWSLVFFGLRNPIGGLVVILILILLIVKTIQEFRKVDKMATRLMFPYLIWVMYATLLNGGVVYLNFL